MYNITILVWYFTRIYSSIFVGFAIRDVWNPKIAVSPFGPATAMENLVAK